MKEGKEENALVYKKLCSKDIRIHRSVLELHSLEISHTADERKLSDFSSLMCFADTRKEKLNL